MATGHIRKRTTKTGTSWQLVVESDRNPVTGKRDRTYKTFNGTKKQAEVELRNLIYEIENHGVVVESTMRLDDWMHSYLADYLPNIADSTRESYEERIAKRISPYLGKMPLSSITTEHVQHWVSELNESLSPKSVRNLFNILRPALEQAVLNQRISRNPCVGVKLKTLVKQHGDVFDKKEIDKALTAAEGTTMYLPLLLELSTGMRRGEAIALTWDDVNFEKREITIDKSAYTYKGERKVKRPKTLAGIRTLTVGQNLIDYLTLAHEEYLSNKVRYGTRFTDSNLVVCQEDGKPYHPDSMSTKWRRFIKKHNLKDIRFHDLRHTNATMMIEAGVDYKTVKDRMGHSDVSTTLNIYTHRTKKTDENAAQKIDDILYS